ncbi:hypothetical protein BDZ94DRAFT_1233266 [Collybia nuda]|uniref:Uncharacterized protein n=1 Tax=Collybia nuda TaxID=64659 RepID=A0A9P5YEK6_9AGAR|nr:hypothetical protein BDZ94DRAFT_1233266 [Collybia nuda]
MRFITSTVVSFVVLGYAGVLALHTTLSDPPSTACTSTGQGWHRASTTVTLALIGETVALAIVTKRLLKGQNAPWFHFLLTIYLIHGIQTTPYCKTRESLSKLPRFIVWAVAGIAEFGSLGRNLGMWEPSNPRTNKPNKPNGDPSNVRG